MKIIRVSEETHRALKIYAVKNDRKMQNIVETAVVNHLNKEANK